MDLDGGEYFIAMFDGDGTITISGDASGEVDLFHPLIINMATSGKITLTPNGTVKKCIGKIR